MVRFHKLVISLADVLPVQFMKADAPGGSQTLKPRCSNQPSLPHSRSKIRHASSHQATQIYEKCKSCLVRYSLTSTHRPTSPDRPGDPGDPPRYRICVSRLYQALSRLGLARVGFTTKLDDSKTSPPMVVEPTHLQKYAQVKFGSFPHVFWCENKK